jgi:hypothetical protein
VLSAQITSRRRIIMPVGTRRFGRAAALTTIATVAAMTVASPGVSAVSSVSVASSPSHGGPKPGLVGSVHVVASQVSFDGDQRAYSMASDKAGNAYLAWISSSATSSSSRRLYLCTLPLGAKGCRGGAQSIALTDAPTSAGLRLLATPGGTVTAVWYHTEAGGGEIAEATSTGGGPLSAEHDVASAPTNGELLDAELAPDGSIWTLAEPGSGSPLELREGTSHPETTIKTPYGVGYAQLAFAHHTPIIAITKDAAISQATAYAYQPGSHWTAFKNVKGTWSDGTDVSLVATHSGVRLITGMPDADYTPAVARWDGHGFKRRTPTGDTCELGAHAAVTDASGRLADVSNECDKISISNLADTRHASLVQFAPGGTPAGGAPQIATLPRGFAWVAWSTQHSETTSAQGDNLKVAEVRIAGLHRRVARHGAAGRVTLKGPATCMPADRISVGVKGHAAHGWKVRSRSLRLGHKKLHSTLNGAALKAGKKYTLKGKVKFSGKHGHSTISVKLKFRACPKP